MSEKLFRLPDEIKDQLQEGLRIAEDDQVRWTIDEVSADAKKTALEWRKSLKDPKSA